MNILFFDTETTGLPRRNVPDNDASMPRCVQLAAILSDENGKIIRSLSSLIQLPLDVEIEQGAFDAHGITKEYALTHGTNAERLFEQFDEMRVLADLYVAHNYFFDKRIANKELHEAGYPFLDDSRSFCTMLKTTDICQIPHKNGRRFGSGNYKWPRLEEAYQFLFNESFDGAHDALNDVRATMRIYFELKNRHEFAKC